MTLMTRLIHLTNLLEIVTPKCSTKSSVIQTFHIIAFMGYGQKPSFNAALGQNKPLNAVSNDIIDLGM